MAGEGRRKTGDNMNVEARQAMRFLVRRPGLSSAIVLTVALAIAATTVAFAVVDGVLLEALPYADADRVVVIWERNIPRARETNVVSPANFLAWRERARSYSDMASAIAYSVTRTGDGEPERIGGVDVTASLFRILEAKPLVGRLFTEEDDRDGGPAVVVLSEGYWRRSYGSDPSAIGRSITLNGRPNTIIGVLPQESDVAIAAEFGGTGTHDVWSPAQWNESAAAAGGRYLQVFARLAPNATLDMARREMEGVAARLLEEYPDRQAGWGVNVITLREQIVGDIRTTLLVMLGAVCFVLLIACANVANLLLTRAVARQQEMSVRTALGAGRGRLLRQLLLESLMLSAAGGVAGIALAYWSLRALLAGATDIPRAE
jgi:predicted permease